LLSLNIRVIILSFISSKS